MNVAGFVCIADEELMVRAMRDAQLLLTEHIERGAGDAEEALSQLLEILDRPTVDRGCERGVGDVLLLVSLTPTESGRAGVGWIGRERPGDS